MKYGFAWAIAIVGVLALGAEVLPLSEVRPGMTGYGLTVVAGTEIERFEVEVVAVLDEPGDRGTSSSSGSRGRRSPARGWPRGCREARSTSRKLAGALSRAAPWSADRDRPLALVTPIEPMLQVLAEVTPPKGSHFPPGDRGPRNRSSRRSSSPAPSPQAASPPRPHRPREGVRPPGARAPAGRTPSPGGRRSPGSSAWASPA